MSSTGLWVGVVMVSLLVSSCGGEDGSPGPDAASAPDATTAIDAPIACTDQCASGTEVCLDSVTVRRCGNTDSDPCAEWEELTDCGPAQACFAGVGCEPGFAVSFNGVGPGSVEPSVGAACGSGCLRSYAPGTVIDVSAQPDLAAHFVGWSGGTCAGVGDCTVSGAATVTATFAFDCTISAIEMSSRENRGDIVADATHVYWTSMLRDEIKRWRKAGGPVEIIATGSRPVGITVDATHVYWTQLGDQKLMRRLKTGGAVEEAPSQSPIPMPGYSAGGGVVNDATHVYWIGEGNIYRWPKAGGLPQLLVWGQTFGSDVNGQNLAVDDEYVYWAMRAGGWIMRVAKNGGTSETIATGQEGAFGIALTDADIYWSNFDTATISRAPKAGGAVVVVATTAQRPTGLTIEDGYLYWGHDSFNSHISRLPLAGGPVEAVAFVADGNVRDTFVEAGAIYYTRSNSGTSSVHRMNRVGTCAP